MTVGRIERVPLREVWKHEALDFTKWLEQNIDALNEELHRTFASAEREQNAGDFSVDIVAEDESGNVVIIENQLEKSDHDHLGKLITYTATLQAKTAVWIVSDPRPEHVQAVSWLNECDAVAFYLVKVEAVRIGDSEPAPLLTVIVGPPEEAARGGTSKRELAERHLIRRRFWTQLLDRARGKTKLFAGVGPSHEASISAGAGVSGLSYNYVVMQHDARVGLYIDLGKGSEKETEARYDALLASREQVEAAFGCPLVWQRLEGKRACRIKHDLPGAGYKDAEERWPEIQDRMIDAMVRFEAAFRPHIAKLKE
ncbi:MAG TPA: DUF4268 domain-containing protein [Armatimonadota bacterium]|nr:DUF4268 domain-containing protein [Armatimonadota bacterium]HQK93616.1 DUF4268 domain-containing protein [Armatimonadota bacterium]